MSWYQHLQDLYKVLGDAGACRKGEMGVGGSVWLAHLLRGYLWLQGCAPQPTQPAPSLRVPHVGGSPDARMGSCTEVLPH